MECQTQTHRQVANPKTRNNIQQTGGPQTLNKIANPKETRCEKDKEKDMEKDMDETEGRVIWLEDNLCLFNFCLWKTKHF